MDGKSQPVELVNQTDDSGNTPLHIACLHKKSDVVSSLIDAGADINAQNNQKLTPLCRAMEFLLKISTSRDRSSNGIQLAVDRHMQNATEISATDSAQFKKIVTLLIDAGVDPNSNSVFKITPLHVASMFWWKDLASHLVKAGANVNAKDFVTPPLVLATQSMRSAQNASPGVTQRFKQMLSYLIDEGADVNIPGGYGLTALHYASQMGDDKMVKYLLDAGANVGAQDRNGMTALHYAAQHGHKEIIQRLMSHSS